MEPIDITVRFNAEGKINPVNFIWKGVNYTVESTGRSWTDERGYHILAMAPGGRVFELLFVPAEARWYLEPVGPGRTLV